MHQRSHTLLFEELSYLETWHVTGVVLLGNSRGNSANTSQSGKLIIMSSFRGSWSLRYLSWTSSWMFGGCSSLSKCFTYRHSEGGILRGNGLMPRSVETEGDLNAALPHPGDSR